MADFPITFSPQAMKHIAQIIERKGGGVFRLGIKQTGCSGYMYQPEVIEGPIDTDVIGFQTAEFEAYIDPAALSIVQGTHIDFVEKSFGMKQLVYDNPNANGLCGCGESFHLNEEKTDE